MSEEETTKSDLIDLLKAGSEIAIIELEDDEKIKIQISEADDDEHSLAKQNVEFIVNSARDAIKTLTYLGKQTGNPRYFETVARLLGSIDSANWQLLKVREQKIETEEKNNPALPNPGQNQPLISADNVYMMSTKEAMDEAKRRRIQSKTEPRNMKEINP